MKTQSFTLLLLVLFLSSCKKEYLIDETPAYLLTIKGKVKDSNGNPLLNTALQLENSYSNNKSAEFCCNSAQTDNNGAYNITLYLEEGKEKEGVLSLYPFCYYQYYMKGDVLKLNEWNDYRDIAKKGKMTIERDIIAEPTGAMRLNCQYPSSSEAIITYKTKNPITKKEEEVVTEKRGISNSLLIKALPNEKLTINIKVYRNNTQISEYNRDYTLDKFQLLEVNLKSSDFK